jgi:hypothetical protein
MNNLYQIKMDSSKPETNVFPLNLTESQLNELRKYVDGKQTDSVQDLVIKLLKKV